MVTDAERLRVCKAALEAREGSYSPYSKFRVGAALLTAEGAVVKGSNIENASFGGTICAERTALVKAVSEGTRQFVALAVSSDVKGHTTPCGICRQFIREFSTTLPIYLVPADYDAAAGLPGGSGVDVLATTIAELLPMSFGPEDLHR